MAVTVAASKSNISGSTTAESSWVEVYRSTAASGWNWYLQAKAVWTITKSNNTYRVSSKYYIRMILVSGTTGSSTLNPTAMSGGSRTGFDTLGNTVVSFSSKSISSLASQTTLGLTTIAEKDVSNVYTDTTSSGSLLYYIKLKITTGSTSESVNVNFTFNGSFYGTKIKTWDIAYYANSDFGGNYIDGKPVQDGKSYTVIKAPTRTFDDLTFNYYVSFNTNGGIPSQETRDRSISQSRTYRFDSWSGVAPGTILTAHSDRNFTEQYHIDYSQLTYKTIGSLPTINKKGYIKTNEWFYPSGSSASPSDEVKSSTTLHVEWSPQMYKISFNLNGGQMPEDMGKISDYTTDKTYAANSARTPNFTPLRLGYKFIGWSDQTKSITPIGVNEFIPDTFYNAVNTEYTNNNVTLYAQWEYNVNTVRCVYYLADDGSEQIDTHTYNIDTATLDPQGDKAFLKYAPNQLRSGDFVFLGWLDAKPDGWDNTRLVNNGYHGTYTVPPEKVVDTQGHEIEIELPIDIKIKNYKDLNSWGLIETYYGIWAKTGKYMKINGSWKKVNKCFVKINGVWKTVTDIWTKQSGSWKHEI